MTHPDILKTECFGYIGREPKHIGHCAECGHEIVGGEEHFEETKEEGRLYCSEDCYLSYYGIELRRG